jgi:imidazolonepropionase-like amidohydrolase
VTDLRPLTAVPGLIDVHTHLTYYWDANASPQQQGGRLPQMLVFLAQENARKTLESGVTTVRDLGAGDYNDIVMRDLINRGAMAGPRMFVSGYGLHVSGRPPRPGYVVPPGGNADGVPEVMRVVREQIGAGADWIKMYASSGTGFDVSTHQTYTYDEMRAAVEVAHNWGKKIAIHSYGGNGARDAVRAGADSVEHAIDIDDAALADMAKRGIFYVPTVDHNRYYIDAHTQLGYPDRQIPAVQAYIDKNLETVRRAHKAGVKIAMGSDAVYTMFGQNTRELEQFIKAGMTPTEALATATSRAAELMGMEKDIGIVAPGSFADLAVIDGDPLADITAVTRHVRCTIKGGAVVAGDCGKAK